MLVCTRSHAKSSLQCCMCECVVLADFHMSLLAPAFQTVYTHTTHSRVQLNRCLSPCHSVHRGIKCTVCMHSGKIPKGLDSVFSSCTCHKQACGQRAHTLGSHKHLWPCTESKIIAHFYFSSLMCFFSSFKSESGLKSGLTN